jgi:hypothetical protein
MTSSKSVAVVVPAGLYGLAEHLTWVNTITQWAQKHEIDIKLIDIGIDPNSDCRSIRRAIFLVPDDQHGVMFALRWGA